MGCNSCKDKDNLDKLAVFKNADSPRNKKRKSTGFLIFEYSMKIAMFSITMLISPLILLFVWYLLFKTIILNNGKVNIMPFLILVGGKLGIGREEIDYENDDDYEDLDVNNPDDYVLVEPIDEIKL